MTYIMSHNHTFNPTIVMSAFKHNMSRYWQQMLSIDIDWVYLNYRRAAETKMVKVVGVGWLSYRLIYLFFSLLGQSSNGPMASVCIFV